MNVEQFWSHNSKQITSRFSWFMQIRCIYNLMQITMAGTFFMMRFWTHLMLFFQANHHGTKVFVKPFSSESTANHHGRSVFHVWILSTFYAIVRSKSPAGSRGLWKYDASIILSKSPWQERFLWCVLGHIWCSFFKQITMARRFLRSLFV